MSRIVNLLNIGHYLKKEKKRFERSSRYVNCVRYPRNIDTRDIRVWRWILFRCNNSWECLFSSIEKEVIWFEKKREGRSVKGYVSSSLVKIFLSLLWSRSIRKKIDSFFSRFEDFVSCDNTYIRDKREKIFQYRRINLIDVTMLCPITIFHVDFISKIVNLTFRRLDLTKFLL